MTSPLKEKLYKIKNQTLELTVSTLGAEIKSLIYLPTGKEIMWQADPKVWKGTAPILFPHVGNLKDDAYTYNGKTYSSSRHGFTRRTFFTAKTHTAHKIVMQLESNDELRAQYPFNFRISVTYTLTKNGVKKEVKILNTDNFRTMHFGLGFHPALALPFAGENHPISDYYLEFDKEQVKLKEVEKITTGEFANLLSGKFVPYKLRSGKYIDLKNGMFSNDSICFTDLAENSKALSLVEKSTGRRISVNIQDFPYVAIWSINTKEMRFICIEPWYTVNDFQNAPMELDKKPLMELEPGQDFKTTLSFSIHF